MAVYTPPTVSVYVEFGDQIVTGSEFPYDENGTTAWYGRDGLIGLESTPGVKGSINQNIIGSGGVAGHYSLAERNIELSGSIEGPTQASVYKRGRALLATVPMNEAIPFVWHYHNEVWHCMVKNLNDQFLRIEPESEGRGNYATFKLLLVAENPQILSGDGSGPTKDLLTETPGVSGSISYSNAGDGNLPPTLIRVTDCTDPILTVDGVQQRFNVVVPAGQWLEVNFEERKYRVTLNGVNARSKMVGRTWLPLKKGGNTVQFDAASMGSTARMNIKTYDSL